jgi:pimeloyl-ACP methyl ester carboxylesterase
MHTSSLSTALRLLGLAIGVIMAVLSLWLLLVRESQQGLLFGLAGLALALAPLLAGIDRVRNHPALKWAPVGALGIWVVLTLVLYLRAPDGRTSPTARVQNRYADGQWHFRRLALGNLLPELDQLKLGFQLVPYVDHLFNRKQARTLDRWTTGIYQELEKDADFHALGSVMPDAYDEIWGFSPNRGHYFLCKPRQMNAARPAPVLVFLHGSGGNFKAYTWLLSQLADELGVVVIAPTYGVGTWRQQDTARVITAALNDAAKAVSLDRSQVHLMGLSNGGEGVCQAAAELGSQLRSLSLLSPVFDLRREVAARVVSQWKGRPVLVVTGALDDRVPHDYVTSAVETLQRGGINVAFKTIEDADHFMLFSHRKAVTRLVMNWLQPQLTQVLAGQ